MSSNRRRPVSSVHRPLAPQWKSDPARRVCGEGRSEDADDIAAELDADEWRVIAGFDVPGGVPPGGKIVCVGDVRDETEAGQAVLAAVWGAGVLVRALAERDVTTTCARTSGVSAPSSTSRRRVRRHLSIPSSVLSSNSCSTEPSVKQRAISISATYRRSPPRRARDERGVETTTEALVESRRLGLT